MDVNKISLCVAGVIAFGMTQGVSAAGVSDEVKGPPGYSIYQLFMKSPSESGVYANGAMQAEVNVYFEIDAERTVKNIEFFQLYTKTKLPSEFSVSMQQNKLNGIEIPTAQYERNYYTADSQVQGKTYYISSDRIKKQDVCVSIELDNGEQKDTCDGNTNNGVVALNFIPPKTYNADEFVLSRENNYYAKHHYPILSQYVLRHKHGEVGFQITEEENDRFSPIGFNGEFLTYPKGWMGAPYDNYGVSTYFTPMRRDVSSYKFLRAYKADKKLESFTYSVTPIESDIVRFIGTRWHAAWSLNWWSICTNTGYPMYACFHQDYATNSVTSVSSPSHFEHTAKVQSLFDGNKKVLQFRDRYGNKIQLPFSLYREGVTYNGSNYQF